MKKIFLTVGPSQLYPTVPGHIQTALAEQVYSLSHRSAAFSKFYETADKNLRELLHIPPTHHIFFTACALEGMERTIQNTVEQTSFHFVNGSFSREFYRIATDLKKHTILQEAPNGEGFDLASVIIPEETELVCMVNNETSTGVALPLDAIYALRKRYPQMLFAVDVVSSIPYVSLDFSLIDIALFSVQKGFGLPAGLGVLIVNDKALAKAEAMAEKGINIGSYHNFLKLREFEKKYQTRETPNVGAIYLLGKVAGDMLAYGQEKMREETEEKAQMLYAFFDKHEKYKPFVAEPFRSKTTIVIDAAGESAKIVESLAQQGIIVAQGYGKSKDQHIRIANFPAVSVAQTKQFLTMFQELP